MDLLKSLFKGDKVIWVVFLMLCLISAIEVFSAASTLTYKSGNYLAPISQHCTYMMLGAGVVLLVHKVPCKLFHPEKGVSLLPWLLQVNQQSTLMGQHHPSTVSLVRPPLDHGVCSLGCFS